ncbi:MAG: hypothetical protein GDA36_06445 [Rhodobacteraceae bacterium]|nr:hypothetical protein [Paracoccaceae bacterium]
MLGQEQLDFTTTTFMQSKDAGKPWRVLANQVVMGHLNTPDLKPHIDEASIAAIKSTWAGIRPFVELSKFGLPVYLDSWTPPSTIDFESGSGPINLMFSFML